MTRGGRLNRYAAALLGAALTLGCGGRGDIASSELYEVGGGTASSNAGRGGSGGSEATGENGTGGTDTSPLGTCEPGFVPGTPGRGPCDWLGTDGLCYTERAGACACLCPRDRDSTCVSGLPNGPDGRTPIRCD